MLLQGMVGGWAVIEASHTVSSELNVICHMLIAMYIPASIFMQIAICMLKHTLLNKLYFSA